MSERRPIDAVTSLRNTRRAMGDGTARGRARIATPVRGQGLRRGFVGLGAAGVPEPGTGGPAFTSSGRTLTLARTTVQTIGHNAGAGEDIEFTTTAGQRAGFTVPSLPASAPSLPAAGVWGMQVTLRLGAVPSGTEVLVVGGSGERLWPVGTTWVAGRDHTSPTYLDVSVPHRLWDRDLAPAVRVIPPSGETVDVTYAEATWGIEGSSTSRETLLETVWVDSIANATDGTPVSSDMTLTVGQSYTLVVVGNHRGVDGSLGAGADDMLFPSSGQPTDELANQDADFKYASDSAGVGGHLTVFEIDLGSGFSHVEPVGGAATEAADGHEYRYSVTGEGSVLRAQITNEAGENNGQLRVQIWGVQ